MSFRNPIIGGNGTLVRQAMQSEGFVAGSTGWRIERDGTAEFNGATFRGNVVLDGTGTLLVYDNDGVIIAAISPSGGTDPAGSGQTYQPGIDTYAQSGGSPTYEVNVRDGFIVFNYVSPTLFTQRGLVQANEPLDATVGPSLGVYAPSDNADERQAAVVCFGTSVDGSDEHHVSITGLDPLDSNAPIPTTVEVNGDLNVSGGLTVGGSVWTDYTPSWTASTTAPTIGNGTLEGAYTRVGDSITFYAHLQIGSTSTTGSGAYGLSLPVPQHATAHQSLTGWIIDATGPTRRPVSVMINGSNPTRILNEGASGFGISSASPWTWTTGDELCIGGTYRAA